MLRIRGKRLCFGRKSVSATVVVIGGLLLLTGGGAVYAALQLGKSEAQSVNLQNGLAGWWKMDGNGTDSSGNGNTVTTTNVTPTSDRKSVASKAYSFAGGASNYMAGPTGTTGSTLSFTTNFSLSAWINPSSYHTAGYFGLKNGIIARGPATTYNYGLQATDATTVTFIKRTGAEGIQYYHFTGVPDLTNQWTHVTATVNGTSLKLYVNGVLFDTKVVGSIAPGASDPFLIGSSTTGQSEAAFIGSIDDVRVYSRTINASEAKALYSESNSYVKLAGGEKGLVSWWKFDGNAKDATPYGNNGVVTGATATADRKGSASSAYSFDGVSAKVTANTPAAITKNGTYTISAWVKLNDVTTPQTIIQASQGCSDRNSLSVQNGSARFGYYDGTAWVSVYGAISAGVWTHLVGVNQGGSVTLYVNGVPSTTPGNPYAVCTGTVIGAVDNNTRYVNGVIDDVRMYSRVLSQSEIQQQYRSYNSQININSSPSSSQAYNLNAGLVAYWPFSGNAKDTTPYQRNGTVNGATLTTDRKGVANRAYGFNGTSNNIDYGTGANYDYADFTVSVWAKSNVATPAHVTNIIGKGNWNQTNSWYIGFRSGPSLSFVYGSTWNTGPVYSVGNFDATQWHHYVGVATASQLKLYLDGNLVNTTTLAHGSVTNTSPLQIGRSSYTNVYFGGSVDDARLYNRALSAGEVTALYSTY